jgi:hypothetical protein
MQVYNDSYFTGALMLYPLTSFVILFLWVPTQISSIFRAYLSEVPRRNRIRNVRGEFTTWEDLMKLKSSEVE